MRKMPVFFSRKSLETMDFSRRSALWERRVGRRSRRLSGGTAVDGKPGENIVERFGRLKGEVRIAGRSRGEQETGIHDLRPRVEPFLPHWGEKLPDASCAFRLQK